jgi:excisionase family DNA binding protein
MPPDGEFIRIGEAAKLLGIHPSTLHTWALQGRVRHYRIGPAKRAIRFLRSDILALIDERRAKGEPEPPEGE